MCRGEMKLATKGPWFIDQDGRTLLLRGVNLSGSSKVPIRPNGATHIRDGFFEHNNVSFVGRPFALGAEADEHFLRLKQWGLTFLRFLVTWEAVEHEGPGIYDEEYLDYLYQVVKKAGEYGFRVLIDPHQDVWSRFSGGDGAPGWTLEAVGFDLAQLHESGGAFLHQIHGDPLPPMIWPTNGARLAAATMFTLFFGGSDFAPNTLVDGEPAQEYLQRHYVAAFQQVARRLKDLDCVVGYEVMNEPLSGFIGLKDLTKPTLPVKFGPLLTPLQSMLLGAGIPQEIEIWKRHLFGSRLIERRLFNPKRLSIWREGYHGIWSHNKVWELDDKGCPRLLRPHHFYQVDGRVVDFSNDYLLPLAKRFAAAIHAVDEDAVIFLETDPRLPPPKWEAAHDSAAHDNAPPARQGPKIAYAPHWYDATVLFLKTFVPWIGFDVFTHKVVIGKGQVQRSFAQQLARYKQYAAQYMGSAPTLIGEIGIAYDLNNRQAFRSGNFKQQVQAMDRSLRAADDTLLSYTIWNYTPDNDNERGDQWNGEDLSIYSKDQRNNPQDLNAGGRALEAVIRPYPMATAGEPLRLSFDINQRVFYYSFKHDPAVQAPTEIFVPKYQYPRGCNVWVSDGSWEMCEEEQKVIYRHSEQYDTHQIRITAADDK
jgi:hypothetical protein